MTPQAVFEEELSFRRERLSSLLAVSEPEAGERRQQLVDLLLSVDSALERLDAGTFGLCTVCHGTLDDERLLRDPLATVCLECMTAEQRGALEHDLETASRFQAAQLPPSSVSHGGWEAVHLYEPFGAVSGDTLDLVSPSAEGPLDLLFGDVSGKGVAASLLQSSLRTLFRVLGTSAVGPAELLRQINRLFFEATVRNAYATLTAFRLAPDGRVEFANAGHLPVIRTASGAAEPLDSPSLPVGLFRDATYAERSLELAVGESLVFYTDGLTESTRADGEEYGGKRVAALAGRISDRPPAEMVAALRADLETFLEGAPRSDDLALLVVRRSGAELS